jgi:4-hydroxybutyrate CoA-transferase
MLPMMQTPQEAARHIQSGMNVFVHGAAMAPVELLEALCQRTDLEGVTLYHLHLDGPAPMADPEVARRVRSVSLFTGASMRAAVRSGIADFMPVFLKDIPGLFRSGTVRLDVALLQLSPPDRHGNCSLGTSVDAALDAADCAPLVIAQINDQVPRTHGSSTIPASSVTARCSPTHPRRSARSPTASAS